MNIFINRKSKIKKVLVLFYASFIIFTSVFMKYQVSVHADSDTDSDFITNDFNFARMVLFRDMAHGYSVNTHDQDYQNFLDGYSSGIGGRLQRYCVEELGADEDDIKKVTPIYQYSIDNPLLTVGPEIIIHGIAYTYDKLIDGFSKWDAENFELTKNNDINMADFNESTLATFLLSLPTEVRYPKKKGAFKPNFKTVQPLGGTIDNIVFTGNNPTIEWNNASDYPSLECHPAIYIYWHNSKGKKYYSYIWHNSYQLWQETNGMTKITFSTYGVSEYNYNGGVYTQKYDVGDASQNIHIAPTIINNIFNTENYHEGDTLRNTDNLYSDEFSLNYNRINGLYYIPIKVDTSKLTEEQKKNCPCEIVSLPQGDFLMLPITQDNYHIPDLLLLNQLVDNGYCTQQDFTNQFRSIMNYTVINKDGDVYNYNNETVSKDTYYNEVNEYNKNNYIPNGMDITKIFPFCLPFDISRLLTPFNAEPVIPKFVVNFSNFNSNIKFSDSSGSADASSGSTGGGNMDIDFNTLKIDELAKLIRTGEIVLFTISLAIWFFKAVSK